MSELYFRSYDPLDPAVEKFRVAVLREDLNIDTEICDGLASKREFEEKYSEHPLKEEVFKFSRKKWNSLGVSRFYGAELNGEIVSLSGARAYKDDFLRVGMHYYTLKRSRTHCRSPLWRAEGFIDQAISEHGMYKTFFISIYPHNRKLSRWVEKLMDRRGFAQMANSEVGVNECLKRFEPWPHLISFNSVPQLILFHSKCPISKERFKMAVEGNLL